MFPASFLHSPSQLAAFFHHSVSGLSGMRVGFPLSLKKDEKVRFEEQLREVHSYFFDPTVPIVASNVGSSKRTPFFSDPKPWLATGWLKKGGMTYYPHTYGDELSQGHEIFGSRNLSFPQYFM